MHDSTRQHRALVQGAGALDGIGSQCALAYAAKGATVIASGRNADKLAQLQQEAQKRQLPISVIPSDATDPAQVASLFDQAEHELGGPLNLVHFNAGNNMPGKLSEMSAEYFEECWRICSYAGFLCAGVASERMLKAGEGGTILFTGASASMRGRANFGAFNSAKGALRLMAQALAKELGPEGIHVGHVIVDGAVEGDRLRTLVPKLADEWRDKGVMIDIEQIVNAFIYLWQQSPSGWSFEMDVRTAREAW